MSTQTSSTVSQKEIADTVQQVLLEGANRAQRKRLAKERRKQEKMLQKMSSSQLKAQHKKLQFKYQKTGRNDAHTMPNMMRWNQGYSETEASKLGDRLRSMLDEVREGKGTIDHLFELNMAFMVMHRIWCDRIKPVDEAGHRDYEFAVLTLSVGVSVTHACLKRIAEENKPARMSQADLHDMKEAIDVYQQSLVNLSPITITTTLEKIVVENGGKPIEWRELI